MGNEYFVKLAKNTAHSIDMSDGIYGSRELVLIHFFKKVAKDAVEEEKTAQKLKVIADMEEESSEKGKISKADKMIETLKSAVEQQSK